MNWVFYLTEKSQTGKLVVQQQILEIRSGRNGEFRWQNWEKKRVTEFSQRTSLQKRSLSRVVPEIFYQSRPAWQLTLIASTIRACTSVDTSGLNALEKISILG